jgi:hypothetical protein
LFGCFVDAWRATEYAVEGRQNEAIRSFLSYVGGGEAVVVGVAMGTGWGVAIAASLFVGDQISTRIGQALTMRGALREAAEIDHQMCLFFKAHAKILLRRGERIAFPPPVW